MLEYLSVQAIEVAVGIIAALILIGGTAAYIAYRIWAKKHGKSVCDGNCANCSGCHVTNLQMHKNEVLPKQQSKTTKADGEDADERNTEEQKSDDNA